MWPLYLGYMGVQLYALAKIFYLQSITVAAVFFSLVVFFVWTFIPVIGYIFAKAIGAKGQTNHHALLALGAGTGLVENGLFHFEIMSAGQHDLVTGMVFMIFFVCGYLTIEQKNPMPPSI